MPIQSLPGFLYLAAPGEGPYELRGSAFPIGEYPAGQTAMIGSFFESSVIEVVGTDLPKTYLTVPEASGDSR